MGVSIVRWWPVVILVSLTLSNHLVEPEDKKKYAYNIPNQRRRTLL